MPVISKETLNPHLRRSFRVLVPTFDALIRERFPDLGESELAQKLNIEIKTLHSIREGNVIYGETIRKLSEALKVPVYGFAENQTDTDVLRTLLDAASNQNEEFSRWPFLQLCHNAHHLLRRINGLWHWSDRVHDNFRPHRRIFKVDQNQVGFGLFEIEFEGPILDAILSYELVFGPLARGRTNAIFGLFIDYGQIFRRKAEDKIWALELWILRSWHKKISPVPGNKVQFVTWFGPHAGNFLIRSQSPCTIKFIALLSGEEGDARLQDANDPLVGYQRWAAHMVNT